MMLKSDVFYKYVEQQIEHYQGKLKEDYVPFEAGYYQGKLQSLVEVKLILDRLVVANPTTL